MTTTPVLSAATGITPSESSSDSYVEWSAVLAGAVLASAISFVLLTFGAAIGLSLTSPYKGEGASFGAFAVATGLWALWVTVASFLAGGYLTGRLRKRMNDASEHESDVRDGAHGLLVWASGVLIGAVLAFGATSGAASKAADGAVAVVASGESATPVSLAAIDLFRPVPGASRPVDQQGRAATLAILARTAETTVPAADRDYAALVVADQTGVSAADAALRVDQAHAQIYEATAEAKKAADTARKVGVIAAFLLAASLVVSAAAAYVAATIGGNHRDKQTVVPFFVRRKW
ncbi:MAG: hypothetical protein ABWZ40_13075 [Caulobacterales bacterium]